ncbi:MAG: hypothetical protein NTZ70_00560 [Methylococcales bacterium]|nr:hypothetical protein [Methylococcales bacterium]
MLTPDANYNGTVQLSYGVIDNKGGSTNGVINFVLKSVVTPPPTCTNGQILNAAQTACVNPPVVVTPPVVTTSGKSIVGTAGNDSITGTDGDDTLDGGVGKDRLTGGDGDDIYIVDNKGDKVIEELDAGTDTVLSSITYILGNNLENLELLGVSKINATGNALDNELLGNDGNNILNGMVGDDFLIGGKGSDKLTGGKGADTFMFRMDDFFPADENGDYIFNKSVDTITDFNLKDGDTLNFDGLQFYPDLVSAKVDEPQLFYVKGTIYLNIDTTALNYTPVAIIKLTGNPKVNADFTNFSYPPAL